MCSLSLGGGGLGGVGHVVVLTGGLRVVTLKGGTAAAAGPRGVALLPLSILRMCCRGVRGNARAGTVRGTRLQEADEALTTVGRSGNRVFPTLNSTKFVRLDGYDDEEDIYEQNTVKARRALSASPLGASTISSSSQQLAAGSSSSQSQPEVPDRGPSSTSPYRLLLEDRSRYQRPKAYGQLVKELKDGLSFAEVTADNQHECIRRVMCPFSGLPPQEELALKQQKNEEFVIKLQETVRQEKSTFCHPVVPSPVRVGYRLKDEFSVNVGVDGYPKTVGFYVGSPRKGLVCVPPDAVDVIGERHKAVAAAYQRFLRSSPLPANLTTGNLYDNDGGHWRNLFVRSNSSGDTMATVSFHPQEMTADELTEQKRLLAEFFSPEGEGGDAGVASLYFQASTVASGHNAPFELLFGRPHVEQEVAGRRFFVGPDSFFHSNVSNLEQLVRIVAERCQLTSKTSLLDLCSGVGLYGVSFAPLVKRVLGADVSAAAAEEANKNSEANGIRNAEFLAGKLEDCLEDMLLEVESDSGKLEVILNPGRGGVNYRVIEMLRTSRKVHRIVYVSCQPEGNAFANFRDLCRIRKKGHLVGQGFYRRSFRLHEAVPVDMFPGTHCCEHVLVFTR